MAKKVSLIKPANIQVEFTEDMISELERCSRHGISEDYGIVYFARKYAKIQHPTLGRIDFDLRDYQIKILDCYMHNRWSVVLTARQSGKTECTCLYLLWRAMFLENQKILVASRIAKDSKDIVKRVKFMYENLPNFLRPGVTEYNVHTISFDNHSEIYSEATTEDTGRGRSISLLYLDELARVRPRVAAEFWASIMPTLTTGGSCIITSTPGTDTDTYSTIWHGALAEQNGFAYVEVKWDEVPEPDGSKRGEKFKNDIIAKLGMLKWRREYNNEFLSDAETLVSALRMQNIKPEEPILIKNFFKFWEHLKPRQKYVIGVDVGTGTGGDFSTIECFTFPQLVQVAELRENTLSTPQIANRLVWLLNMIDKIGGEAYYSIENNACGEGVLSAIEVMEDNNIDIPGTMFHDSGKNARGYFTGNKAKLKACLELKNLIDTDKPKMIIRSRVLLTELKFYVRTGASFAARLGITDDLISALLIVVRVIRDAVDFDDADTESLYDDIEDSEFDDDEDGVYGIVC